MKKELELYIHIPFCKRKCAYCDFLSGPADDAAIQKYTECLIKEIEANRELAAAYDVTTIFLGGGTPSMLTSKQIQQVMQTVTEIFHVSEDAEITIEANPGTVTKEKLFAYKKSGINRISFGLQSANNEELKMLGRIHTYEEFLESYELARDCGFDNINVDLISAIPRQTYLSWEETLSKVAELKPEHISAYSLIIEAGTPFAEVYGEGKSKEEELPSEEEERAIYKRTEELLKQAGYHRYEISNYAKAGKECRHNLGYWERKNYLGIGLGSASLMDNERFRNTDNMQEYMENADSLNLIRQEREALSREAQMEEFVFLGMRKMSGISLMEFAETFGESITERYGEGVERMKQQGLIMLQDNRLCLTKKGIDVSNYVFAEILF